MTANPHKFFVKEPYVIFVMDLFLSVMASLIDILLIRWVSTPIPGFYHVVLKWCLCSFAATIIATEAFGVFRFSIEYITIRSLSKLAFMSVLKTSLMCGFLLLKVFPEHTLKFRVLVLVFDCLFTFSFLILARTLIVFFVQTNRRTVEQNVVRHRVLVYGVSQKSIAQITRLNDSSRYDIVGIIVTDKSLAGRVISDRKIFAVSSQEELDQLSAQFGGVESILFALDGDATEQKEYLIRWAISLGINVLVSPPIENLSEYKQLSGLNEPKTKPESQPYILSTSETPFTKESVYATFVTDGMSAFSRSVKRIVDFLASMVLIVVFSPLMLACYIAIKIEDGGPAIYRQERIGRFGRPFNILKFRSMRMDAEESGPALYSGEDDPRLTKVGGFLRSHHLDELPQLFNVLSGEMAFVGYRPERQFYIKQIIEKDPRYVYLYQIRPGVTSYATLRNGYTYTLDKMVTRLQFDLFYLRHRSWYFDLKVLWLTFANIIFGKKF